MSEYAYRAPRGVYESACKECSYAQVAQWRKKNPEKVLAAVASYEKRHKDKQNAYRNRYYHENKDKIREQKRALYPKYREKRNKDYKKRVESDETFRVARNKRTCAWAKRPEVRERAKEKHKERQKTDLQYVMKRRLRLRIRSAVKRKGGIKLVKTEQLLGCTVEAFKAYIEGLFTEGMSWKVFMTGIIHLDHIIPCDRFDLTKEEDQRKCFHYSNIQPLWEVDNLRKHKKLDYVPGA
jgi:hypothetical protein